jgi:hypothetical protein
MEIRCRGYSRRVNRTMLGDGRSTTSDDGYRFFSLEQVDRILSEGSRRGRAGSHAAIERILRHEPQLERAALRRRIRQLKRPARKQTRNRIVWGPEDDLLLRTGYESGGSRKRDAIRQILKRHTDWEPSAIWKHAQKLGLARKNVKKGEEFSQHRWSEENDRKLLSLAGEMSAAAIARLLHRSERAVCCRLAWLGERSRVHSEGYARRSLATDLHIGWNTMQKLIVDGFLEVRDPRITKRSIARVKNSGTLLEAAAPKTNGEFLPPSGPPAVLSDFPRAKRLWAGAAAKLSVSLAAVESMIMHGVLKLCDPRITEESFQHFCRNYGAMVEDNFLNQETRSWLRSCMDYDPNAGKEVARRLVASRQHARIVRRCETCGRSIRGNVFFRHFKECRGNQSGEARTLS